METAWQVFLIFGGMVLLVRGADFLVDGSVSLAGRFRVPPLIIGLTIVSIGTSFPELATTTAGVLKATAENPAAASVALGNVVGSNICNTALILGVSAIISPIVIQSIALRREIPTMMFFSALLWALCTWWGPALDFFAGAILFSFFLVFYLILIIHSFKAMQLGKEQEIAAHGTEEMDLAGLKRVHWLPASLMIAMGLLMLGFGADFMLDGSIAVAEKFGLSAEIIGLTIIAIGTSLPELAASAVAAKKGHSDIALGNVLGSNIFNVGLILGVPAMIKDLPLNPEIAGRDIYVMLGLALFLLPFGLKKAPRIVAWEGWTLVGIYAGYLIWLVGIELSA